MADSNAPIQTPRELSSRYRFKSLLGEGANGKTWLAVDILHGIKVAIKELKFSQNDEFKSLELFKREAATLSSIKMEGVPRFYESIFPKDLNNTCYIIQEYVQFPSLQQILNTIGKLPEIDALKIIERISLILFGLHTVYSPPIIHRDIKPSNILCEKKPDGNVNVYLIDFGAVANPQRRSGGSTVAGTFGYMAPEQLLGDICIQSDYYSLGATAFQMVTGVPPWKLSSDTFKVDFESALREYAPKTSPAYRSLLEILLAPEIDKRPANGKQLLNIVHNVQKGHPVSIKTLDQTMPTLKKKRWYERIYDKLFSSQVALNESTWIEAPGKIEAIAYMLTVEGQPQGGYEYTFEFNNICYVGIQTCVFAKSEKYSHFPCNCVVIFDPFNPRINKLKLSRPSGIPVGLESA